MRIGFLTVLCGLLLTSCATGESGETDGVITGGDARKDLRDDDDTAADDDTGSSSDEDTGSSSTDDTGSASGDSGASSDDTGSSSDDTGSAAMDSGTPDTGSEMDTGTTDTGATCSGEEPEPNNTTATARALGTINDCDGSGKTVTGILSTTSDVDVLTFTGDDDFGCSVNPTVTASGSVTVCIRAACTSGTTELKSCPKGTKSGSECCGKTVEAEINCTGTTSDNAKIYITVRADSTAGTCSGYSLAYHY